MTGALPGLETLPLPVRHFSAEFGGFRFRDVASTVHRVPENRLIISPQISRSGGRLCCDTLPHRLFDNFLSNPMERPSPRPPCYDISESWPIDDRLRFGLY